MNDGEKVDLFCDWHWDNECNLVAVTRKGLFNQRCILLLLFLFTLAFLGGDLCL